MQVFRFGTIKIQYWIILVLCLLAFPIGEGRAEASVTVAWDQTTTNADGTPCTDLAGYKIYYDTDGSGAPYNGTGITEGDSPISVPVASLADPTNPQFVLSGLGSGITYYITVTSYDTSGNESGYSNEVTVVGNANQAPTASAGIDQTVTQSQLSGGSIQVNLDGSGSSDPDGDPLSYSWTQVGGSAVNLMGSDTATPFFAVTTALSGQTLVFQLVVSDGSLNSNSDTVQVVVESQASGGNQSPKASVSATPVGGTAPLSVGFSGGGTDPDGSITSYSWTFGDGGTSSLQNPTHTYQSTGTYSAALTVTDNQGAADTATLQIVVSAPSNSSPTAAVSADRTSGTAPLSVQFTAVASDSDGSITSYDWDFGDGSTSVSANPSHTFTVAGNYTVTLTVTDNDGAQAAATSTISVASPASDSDNDGLSDVREQAYGLNTGTSDSDGDGISDFVEWGSGDAPSDSDGDGIIDALDTDSDNDGKPDADEGIQDDDGDGAANYIDINDSDGPLGDQDGDGINNSTEVTYQMNPNLSDSDGDGISDKTEFGKGTAPADSDGDGIIDALDTDSDDDGKLDTQEGIQDADGDGAPNYIDMNDTDGPAGDQDGDGFTNQEETSVGSNPNLSDSDQDGIPDAEEIGDIASPSDVDGDGIIDALDTDSDNDGIPDSQEADSDMDGNGVPDRLDVGCAGLEGRKGKIALKVTSGGGRLMETVFISNPSSYLAESLPADFSYGGFQYKISDIPVGGSVTVTIYSQAPFPADVEYWKYDAKAGFSKLNVAVSGNRFSFTLTDGGTGDADQTANGVIEDPGFVGEPAQSSSTSSGGGTGGGGGCALTAGAGSGMDGLLLLLPVFVLMLLRKEFSKNPVCEWRK